MDDDRPEGEASKLTRSKRRWASEGRFITGVRSGHDRLPPGQHLVRDWPVLDLGQQPDVPTDRWELVVDGAVRQPLRRDWATFQAQPQQAMTSDIHCVTTWSRYDNRWTGVAVAALLDAVGPTEDASHVLLHSYDGYTTNLPLADFASPAALLAHGWDGKPLTRQHGGPVRLIVPHLYLWKSAKWIRRIEFLTADRAGFWEVNGYHMRGDPWAEQRYSAD